MHEVLNEYTSPGESQPEADFIFEQYLFSDRLNMSSAGESAQYIPRGEITVIDQQNLSPLQTFAYDILPSTSRAENLVQWSNVNIAEKLEKRTMAEGKEAVYDIV